MKFTFSLLFLKFKIKHIFYSFKPFLPNPLFYLQSLQQSNRQLKPFLIDTPSNYDMHHDQPSVTILHKISRNKTKNKITINLFPSKGFSIRSLFRKKSHTDCTMLFFLFWKIGISLKSHEIIAKSTYCKEFSIRFHYFHLIHEWD